jgi:hypothetical protein
MAMSDSVYAYITSVKGYEGGSVMDTGWFASYLAIGLAAYCASAEAGQVRSYEPEVAMLGRLVTSFVPVIVALIAASVAMQLGHGLDGVAWATVAALIALVLIRQALFIRDVLRPGGTEGGGFERLERAILIGASVETDQPQSTRSRGAVA